MTPPKAQKEETPLTVSGGAIGLQFLTIGSKQIPTSAFGAKGSRLASIGALGSMLPQFAVLFRRGESTLTPPGSRKSGPAEVARMGLARHTAEMSSDQAQHAASYFDVDGTLVKTNLVHPLMFYMANQQNPLRAAGRMLKAAVSAPALLTSEQVDRGTFNELLFKGYKGMSEDRLLELADEAFDNVIRPAVFQDARDLVARAKRSGHRVVLISGSPDFLLERLARFIEADDVMGNRLEIRDGKATGRIRRPLVAGPEKAKMMKDHAKEHGFDLDKCAAYSDSMSDVPMLSVVGRPCAVNPDFRLRALAKTHRWPVLDLDQKAA